MFKRTTDRDAKAVVIALVVIGIAQMAAHPKQAVRLLTGRDWWD